jgi:hypothetical protein
MQAEKEARSGERTTKFLEEKPLAATMKAADVIGWGPEDKDGFEQRRLVKKNELSKCIRLKEIGAAFRAHTGEVVSKAASLRLYCTLWERASRREPLDSRRTMRKLLKLQVRSITISPGCTNTLN